MAFYGAGLQPLEVLEPAFVGRCPTLVWGAPLALSFTQPGCDVGYIPDPQVGGSVHEAQPGWFDISGTVAIPAGTRSVAVQAGFLTDDASPALTANFDNIALTLGGITFDKALAPGLARQ